VSDVSTVKQKKRSHYQHLKRGLSLVTKKYKPSIRKYIYSITVILQYFLEFSIVCVASHCTCGDYLKAGLNDFFSFWHCQTNY